MEWNDDGLDDEPVSPLLPPDDRLWRHPSEVAGASGAVGAPERTGNGAAPPARVVTAVALASCISILLTVGVVSLVRPFREADAGDAATTPAGGPSVADLTARVRPAIAQVIADDAEGRRTWGSGVLVRSDGMVLTTHRVVAGAQTLQVVLDDGRHLPARLVGADADTGIAVLDLDGDGYPTARLATDRAAMKVGDRAITIGAPSGNTGPLVRVSMVSAVRQEAGMGGRTFVDVIRTDTAVAEGCSGGAVVDARGRVIGIAVANMETQGGVIGFAMPIDVAKAVADQIVGSGRVTRGWLGIEGESRADGAFVRAVRPGSPAERAGLQRDDVIVEADQEAVDSMAALVVWLRTRQPGDVVTLRIRRDGGEHTVSATLGDKPPDTP